MTGEVWSGGRFGDLILDAISRHGDSPALIDGDRRLSYRELGSRIAQALANLRRLGLAPGDAVAQLAGNSVDMWSVMAAAYIGGYRSVTLHPLGGRDDQAFILKDCGARLLIADAAHAGRAAALARDEYLVLGHEAEGALQPFWTGGEAALPLDAIGAADDVIRIAYTGGTTGRPKGVLLPNRAMVANATMALAAIPFPRAPRFLCPAPVSHGAGSIIVPTLMLGGTVILQRGFDPERFLTAAVGHGANLTWLVPTMIATLLDSPALRDRVLPPFETIIWSGAPMTAGRVRQAVEAFGPVLVQCYGQSEAPNTVLLLAGEEQARHPDAAGRPFPGIEVALLDDAGRPVAAGEPGEICVRGPLVMTGYQNLPDATADAFAHGWLHTGDIGVRNADGLYRIADRKKDMLISGGFNVFPREVEDVIAAQDGVAAVAVIGISDEHWGERVTAIVVPDPGALPEPDRLVAAVREAKGPIHAPKTVHFVDALPLTPLGKPDKQALRRLYDGG